MEWEGDGSAIPWCGDWIGRTREGAACARSIDQMGLAKRLEIWILVGEFFQVVVKFDGPAHVGLGGVEVAPLGGITAEVELDQGIFGMEGGGLRKDFGGKAGKIPWQKP